MPGKTAISWTDRVWNPVTGCSRVSPGCDHCYAEALSLRFGLTEKPWTAINATENVALHPERLDLPLRWQAPSRIFVNSMSDLFHDAVPDDFIDRVFGAMVCSPRHTFQVLTKRTKRMAAYCAAPDLYERWQTCAADLRLKSRLSVTGTRDQWPRHIWMGASVEDQRRADERIPDLIRMPAPVLFLSCEPLLGPILLGRWFPGHSPEGCDPACHPTSLPTPAEARAWRCRIIWVIDGGESGPMHRPAELDWFRSLRDQCLAAGVAYFHKQASDLRPGRGVLLDGQAWHQFPT